MSPTWIHNVIIEIFHISNVSDMSNIGSNYILYYNSNYLNLEILQINTSNYMKLWIKSIELIQIRHSLN